MTKSLKIWVAGEGNLLVSNFSNSASQQGKGTTIMQIAPDGSSSLFAQIDASNLPGPCPGGVGLTSLIVLHGDVTPTTIWFQGSDHAEATCFVQVCLNTTEAIHSAYMSYRLAFCFSGDEATRIAHTVAR
jgi:hypothetical protein